MRNFLDAAAESRSIHLVAFLRSQMVNGARFISLRFYALARQPAA